MQLDREYILRMIKGRSTGAVVVEGSEGGGGGGGSVALGPLLTSLNAEAMPSAEGYLHWTGSAWAFDTPTGGDPVDLTPYALKTWVQDNFAYKNDLVNFITKTEADTYYAALSHTHGNYLPLSAGANKALTGSLYISGNSGINWAGGVGMLACTPESGWTGISSSQWGVGALSAQGVIRSNANDILHYRNGNSYKIWDAYNFTPSDYLPLTGGTVETLTVTNGLDADSITVGSIVNSGTLAEYLDQNASDARYLRLTGGTLTGRLVAGSGVYFGADGNQGGVYYDNGLVVGGNAVRILSDGVFTHNGSNVVTESSLPSLLPFSYLRNSASDDDEQLGTISRLILPLTVAADGTGKKYAQLNLSNYATTAALNTALAGYLPLAGGMLTGALMMGSTNHATNDDSAKIAFNTNVNYQNISPYIQAIYENNYGRKRLSVFQKNVADWDTPQVEVFTILPNGNVGIGTTSPSEKLHVAGNIKATGNVLLPSSGSLSIEGIGAVLSNNGAMTIGGTSVAVESDGVFTFNGEQVATVSSLSGYLPLTGGAMTGNISYKGTKATYDMITFIDNTSDTYGNGIAIGGGGTTIIGGGESAATIVSGWLAMGTTNNYAGNELMYIGNDAAVSIFTNLQNGWNDRKEFYFGGDGRFWLPAGTGGRQAILHPDGQLQVRAVTGGWAYSFGAYTNAGSASLGQFAAHGTNDSLTYMYIGRAYNDTWMVVTPSGNVGIGTTTPTAKLDVRGDISASSISVNSIMMPTGSGYIQFGSGDGYSGQLTATSTGPAKGDIVLEASGNLTLNGGNGITVGGNLTINGDVAATGTIASEDYIKADSDIFVGDSLYFGADYNAPRLYVDSGHLYFNGTRIA